MSGSHPGQGAASVDSSSNDNERYDCSNCDKDYKNKYSLKRHREKYHPDSFDEHCPECGKGFDTKKGMKSHFGRQHNGSLAGVKYDCDYCGDTFTLQKFRLDKSDNVYCSNECQHKAMSDRTGKEHHLYNRVKYDCDNCGKTMERKPSRVKSHDNLYCSRECQVTHDEWVENYTGETSKRHTIECKICGKEFTVLPHRVGRAKYCSKKCRIEATRRITGNERYNYKENGGSGFGSKWPTLAERVRERDDRECVVCGIDESDLPRKLDVHHIIPRSEFNDIEIANDMDNLISVCRPCHHQWEGIPLRPI